jgi:hypothetical protein
MSKGQGPRAAGMRLAAIAAGRRQRRLVDRENGPAAAP